MSRVFDCKNNEVKSGQEGYYLLMPGFTSRLLEVLDQWHEAQRADPRLVGSCEHYDEREEKHAHVGAKNVDSAIRQAENLDKPSKFAPRGTPTRLQQMFGKEGAAAFKQGLYDAQKAGQKVLTRNKVIGIVSGSGVGLGGVYEFLKGR